MESNIIGCGVDNTWSRRLQLACAIASWACLTTGCVGLAVGRYKSTAKEESGLVRSTSATFFATGDAVNTVGSAKLTATSRTATVGLTDVDIITSGTNFAPVIRELGDAAKAVRKP